MATNVSLLAAFVAGVLSISSPCVLPLIPLYLAHLVGVSTTCGEISRPVVMRHAIAYCFGFAFIFIMVGIALGAAGSLVDTAGVFAGNRQWLVRIGGLILVIFGLHMIGLFTIPGLGRPRQILDHRVSTGTLGSSFLIGMTFAAGWSPCAGPILGGILTLAAGQGDPRRAAVLLTAYSVGLAIPFLAFAWFGANRGLLNRIGRHLSTLIPITGGMMIAMGVILMLGVYQQFFTRIAAAVPWSPFEPTI